MIAIIVCALLIIFLVGAFPTLLTRRRPRRLIEKKTV
jgi:hypothetical protein